MLQTITLLDKEDLLMFVFIFNILLIRFKVSISVKFERYFGSSGIGVQVKDIFNNELSRFSVFYNYRDININLLLIN